MTTLLIIVIVGLLLALTHNVMLVRLWSNICNIICNTCSI